MASPLWKVKPPLDVKASGLWLGPGAHSMKDGLWLGSLAEFGPPKMPSVWISTEKEQVIAIVGKRGSGKSFTLGVMLEGLALQSLAPQVSKQKRPRATLLFDPLDTYWTTRFSVRPAENHEAQRHYEMAETARLTDLVFHVAAWVPGSANRRNTDPDWFGTLQLPVSQLGVEEWEILIGVNMLTEPMGQALTDALALVGIAGYRLRGNAVAAVAAFDIVNVLSSLESDELVNVYHLETLRALRQRLSALHATGLFSAEGTAIVDLLSGGQLTIILLGRLPQSYRAAVVAIITRLLTDRRAHVAFAEKRLALDPTLGAADKAKLAQVIERGVPRTVVALDEAQSFLAPGVSGPVRDVFVRLVKEGRNIGLSAIVATQQPSALDQRILSQVETFISHQLVTEADIRAIRDNLKSALPESIAFGAQEHDVSSLLRTLSAGQCLVSAAEMNTNVKRSIVMSVRPRATVHGGIEL